MSYFYDGQLRRYLTQFIRMFSEFQVANGYNPDGTPILKTIPIKMAMTNKNVASIIGNNSETTINATPQMSVYIEGITLSPERRQTPNHTSQVSVTERRIDESGNYTSEIGRSYSIDRYMPVPYDLTMKLDIWTNNESQKHQILEQILTLFNPSLDLQTGTNPIDWSSLTVVELTDINWSSRSIPVGSDIEIDVSSLSFKIPIFINPPVKVKNQQIIQQIVTNILASSNIPEKGENDDIILDSNDFISRQIVTPGNHNIRVVGDTITLLGQNGSERDANGDLYSWKNLLDYYSVLRPSVSQLRLLTGNDSENYSGSIIGKIDFHPSNENQLTWIIDIDTLPQNTILPITAIINPTKSHPLSGLTLPLNNTQTYRYLLLEDIPNNSAAWYNGSTYFTAKENDIIQISYSVSFGWVASVLFNSFNNNTIQYVKNNFDNKQLKWNGESWLFAIDGEYNPGFWKINL